MLVHMTPGEVQGLQKLAVSHGGSLTVNPHTGLPEAGFLSALLPIAAGLALGPAGFGIASSALGAGAMVGGVTALATGSLSKGLMAGLGAYGGFGMGTGLAAAGEAALGAGAAPASALGGTSQLASVGAENFAAPTMFSNAATTAGTTAGTTAAQTAAAQTGGLGGLQSFANPSIMAANPYGMSAAMQTPTATAVNAPLSEEGIRNIAAQTRPVSLAEMSYAPGAGPAEGGMTQSLNSVKGAVPESVPVEGAMGPNKPLAYGDGSATTTPSEWDKLKAGFNDVTSSGSKSWNFVKEHPGPFMGAGLGLAQDLMKQEAVNTKNNPGMIRPYTYDYNPTGAAEQPYSGSGERVYFNPVYTAGVPYKAPGPEYKAADGGLMAAYAVGGPVEQMSAENATSGNTMYPQSQFQTSMYANPMVQRPVAQNVISQGTDTNVDPYTGEQKFAKGGTTGGYKYSFNPQTQEYTRTGSAPVAVTLPGKGFMGIGGVEASHAIYKNPGVISQVAKAAQGDAPKEAPQITGGITQPTQVYQPQVYQAPERQPLPEYQSPEQQLGLNGFYDYMHQQMNGMQGYAGGGMAHGGSHLGGYSDGGRLLRGPGDGVSDSIPAVIGNKQPARLADGEFVVPARIVSEIGNGSTDAGARKLYAMMDRVQKARGKTTGKNQVAKNTKADKFLPS